jgi:hypothetical protein
MWSFLKESLRAATSGRTAGPRAPSVRLAVESLEGREVPSATGLISATANAAGQPVVFAIDRSGALWENNPAFVAGNRAAALQRQLRASLQQDNPFLNLGSTLSWPRPPLRDPVLSNDFLAGWSRLSSSAGSTDPQAFVQISATRNQFGDQVVFGVNRAGQVWENNPRFLGAGWFEVAAADPVDRGIAGISATRNSLGQPVVFIATGAGHVFEFNSAFSTPLQEITTPLTNSAWAATGRISATQDAFGQPVVYVETNDINPNDFLNFNRAIEEWRQTTAQSVPGLDPWSLARGANGIGYLTLSATQDSLNRPLLFALDTQGVVWDRVPQTAGSSWVQLTTGGVTTIDATRNPTGQATVFALATNQTVQQFTAGASAWTLLPNSGTSFGGSLAATQTGNGQEAVFATDTSRGLWEHDPAFAGNGWARVTDQFRFGWQFAGPIL